MIQLYEARPGRGTFDVYLGNEYCGLISFEPRAGVWLVMAADFRATYPTKGRAITAIALNGWHRI